MAAPLEVAVRVIALASNTTAAASARRAGFFDVREAIEQTADFRNVTIDDLRRWSYIDRFTAVGMRDGQRRFYEFPNPKAVGCFLSHMRVCQTSATTLVLEDDAVMDSSVRRSIAEGLRMIRDGDARIVVFGPSRVFRFMAPWVGRRLPSDRYFVPIDGYGFFGTHGVLYSARGCHDVRRVFEGRPMQMQYDSALAYAAHAADLTGVYLQANTTSITQDWSLRTLLYPQHINAKTCCNCNGASDDCFPRLTIALSLVFVVAVLKVDWIRRQSRRVFTLRGLLLGLLVVQNCGLMLSFQIAQHVDAYAVTVVVMIVELGKLTLALGLFLREHSTLRRAGAALWAWRAQYKYMGVPALLYVLQQNALVYAGNVLDAPILHAFVQTKIIWTAALARLVLGQVLTRVQVGAVMLLATGVVLVQSYDTLRRETTVAAKVAGGVAAIGSAVSSAVAGIWMERLFVRDSFSLWGKNVVLALWSIPLQTIAIAQIDGDAVRAHGIFHGIYADTSLVIAFQVVGGLLTALVIRHAGNVAKNFATSGALMLTAVVSAAQSTAQVAPGFWIGVGLLSWASCLFFAPKRCLEDSVRRLWYGRFDRVGEPAAI